MFNSLKARLGLIVALMVISAVVLFQRGITYGLDLQGGTHLALEVEDPNNAMNSTQRADAIDRALQIIRTRVDALGVAEPTIQKVGNERIVVELPGATQEEQQRAKDVIQRAASLKFQIVQPTAALETVLPRIDRVVSERLGATGAAAPAQGQQPGAVGGLFESADSTPADSAAQTATDTAAAAATFSSKLMPAGSSPGIGIFAVAREDVPFVERALALPQVQQMLPRNTAFHWGVEGSTPAEQAARPLYLLESRPIVTGEYLEDAQAQRDPQFGQPIVIFQLNRRGGRLFERGTGQNVGNFMAIVLDEQVFSAPVIQSQISDRGQIEMGGGGIEQARDLALVLRAGALPAPIRIIEERAVGPSLGADSIDKGKVAGIIGVSLVILFMLAFYKLSGVLAVAGLALYVLYLLGMMAGIGATLTFPGIAGLVLSIGMAVDANVLVYERIREELDAGRNVRAAVDQGFHNALPAIIDSNLTTLITCLVLYQIGTGPVRGFAVTLALGLIASMFTAVFVTRTFFTLYLNRRPSAQALSI